MSRRVSILIVLFWLTLGGITTVAVSWACAAGLHYTFDSVESTTEKVGPLTWDNTFIQKRFGLTYINHLRGPVTPKLDRGALRWHTTERSDDASERLTQSYSEELRAGWPFRALRCTRPNRMTLRVERRTDTSGSSGTSGGFGVMLSRSGPAVLERGIELPPHEPLRPYSWRALPYAPLWLGFTANTLFYALLWFGLVLGIRATIALRRTRRGQCPACAYPMGLSPRCSECGTVLPMPKGEDT